MNTTVHVNGTGHYELWFAYGNTCNLPSLKLEKRLKKHAQNVTRIKYGFVKLVVIFLAFNTKCDYVGRKRFCNTAILNAKFSLDYAWGTQ